MPIRNLINEICRHQVLTHHPTISSFADLFNFIDSDHFEKLHFTHTGQQFYHEKFHCLDDDSMALVFANRDVIEEVSDCKLMYVDASFKIDTSEDFDYQLVTILVWVEDSVSTHLFLYCW